MQGPVLRVISAKHRRQSVDNDAVGSDSSDDSNGSIPRCPVHTVHSSFESSITFLLLPFLLGTLTLLTMIVCVSVWASVFRQHMLEAMSGNLVHGAGMNGDMAGDDRHSRRDKLSSSEVNAMFPSFKFTKVETVALCAVGDASCSVCLCAFEEGESLRRLACGHSYHAECLDRWLLTNATCPRCRKAARIRGEALPSRMFDWVVGLRRAVRWSAARVHTGAWWMYSVLGTTLRSGEGEGRRSGGDDERRSTAAASPSSAPSASVRSHRDTIRTLLNDGAAEELEALSHASSLWREGGTDETQEV